MAEKRVLSGKKSTHRSLIVRNGEIGVIRQGVFESHTNFCMEVLHAVKSPSNAKPLFGFVFLVRSTDDVEK